LDEFAAFTADSAALAAVELSLFGLRQPGGGGNRDPPTRISAVGQEAEAQGNRRHGLQSALLLRRPARDLACRVTTEGIGLVTLLMMFVSNR